MTNKLIVLTQEQEHYGNNLKALKLPDLEIIVPKTDKEIEENIEKPNIIFGNPLIANSYINKAKNVVWMQSTFAGIDAMVQPDLRSDYILTNVKDIYGEALAEYALAYMLTFEREVLENIKYQEKKEWVQRDITVLGDKILCVLGVGSIGKHVGRLGKALGMRTLGYRNTEGDVEFFDEIFTGEGLKDCLSQADYVVSVLPNTKDTNDIINKDAIGFMKEDTVFINIGRGNGVDEDALVDAVKQKKIAKAVLDVFKEEPLPQESQLWNTENIFITPHMSGYILNERMFEIFTENYKRFVKGEELLYQVDFSKGY